MLSVATVNRGALVVHLSRPFILEPLSEAPGATSPTLGSNELWGEDWHEVRSAWPLEPTIAHLNHGAYGAVPRPVLEEQQSWRDRMETNPTRFFSRELPAALDEARAEVAHFFGSDPNGIAFVDNATSGVSTVLSCFALSPGDEVLVTDHAYESVAVAAHRWAALSGARVVTAEVPLRADDEAVIDAVVQAVTSETRVAVVEHVTSPTARSFPLPAVIAALHERDVAVVADGAHALAMFDVHLDRLSADFYVGNLHKWGCAPRGTGLVYAAPRWRERLRPLGASVLEPRGFPHAFDDTGTRDLTAWLSAGRALRTLTHLDLERLRRHNVELALAGQLAVASSIGIDDADSLPRDTSVSMQLIPLPPGVGASPERAAAVQEQLSEQAGVEVAVTTWRGQAFIRVSAQAYNSPADYDRLAGALPTVLSSVAASAGDANPGVVSGKRGDR